MPHEPARGHRSSIARARRPRSPARYGGLHAVYRATARARPPPALRHMVSHAGPRRSPARAHTHPGTDPAHTTASRWREKDWRIGAAGGNFPSNPNPSGAGGGVGGTRSVVAQICPVRV